MSVRELLKHLRLKLPDSSKDHFRFSSFKNIHVTQHSPASITLERNPEYPVLHCQEQSTLITAVFVHRERIPLLWVCVLPLPLSRGYSFLPAQVLVQRVRVLIT